MRDIIAANIAPFFLAQAVSDGWERMGIVALSIGATTFIFAYFSKRDETVQAKLEKDRADLAERYASIASQESEERKRLLEENNKLQEQIVSLLKQQITGLDVHVTNAEGDPIPTVLKSK